MPLKVLFNMNSFRKRNKKIQFKPLFEMKCEPHFENGILVTEKETILNEFLSKITFFSDWTEIPEGNQIKMMNTKDKN